MAHFSNSIKQLNEDVDHAYRAWLNDLKSEQKQAFYEQCKIKLDDAIAQMKSHVNRCVD
jgi:hypothetical protein